MFAEDQAPASDIEAEMAVIGSMLIDNSTIWEVAELIGPDDFFRDAHQKVARAIFNVNESGRSVDSMILRDELKKRGWLDEPDRGELTSEYISDILQAIPTAANAAYYARIVLDRSVRRRTVCCANTILYNASNLSVSVEDLVNESHKAILAIGCDTNRSDALPFEEVVREVFESIESRQQTKGGRRRETGYAELDGLTGGFHAGELIVLAARPSVGKTTLAVNIAQRMATEKSTGVLILSLEQSRAELVERMLCSESKVDSLKLRSGRYSQADIGALMDAAGRIRKCPVFIDDAPGRTVFQLAMSARKAKVKWGIGLVIIDYLQLVEPDGDTKRHQREAQVSASSRRLKHLARDLDIPVMTLCQLNRDPEKREDKRPKLHDLRESGAIEQDADVVVLLHKLEEGVVEVNVAKQRNGPVGEFKLVFRKNCLRFEDYAERPGDSPYGYR